MIQKTVFLTLILTACDGASQSATSESATTGRAIETCDCPSKCDKTPPPPSTSRAEISIDDLNVRGDRNAQVTLVVFSDFECPYCKTARERIQEIERAYGSRVRVAFKHRPLPFHANARLYAKAAEAAGRQGKFWQMHDHLFTVDGTPDRDALRGAAESLGLDIDRFERELDAAETARRVEADESDADRLGVKGTPTFFVNGRKIVGVQPLATFAKMIDEELASHQL